MALSSSTYPQIPTTVWWGFREALRKTPNAIFDARSFGVALGVQDTAAQAYLSELKRVGLLNEDGRATELAQRWRLDDTYQDAIGEIMKAYPEGLRAAAPDSSARAKALDWFMRHGLGEGAARNKVATYFLIGSPEPFAPTKAKKEANGKQPAAKPKAGKKMPSVEAPAERAEVAATSGEARGAERAPTNSSNIPLNLNIQIHISADASGDQIEAIFAAMRKYLGSSN